MSLHDEDVESLKRAITRLEAGFDGLPEFLSEMMDPSAVHVLEGVADRLVDNYPYQHPLYLGQMLKPPHPLAMAAYLLAMQLNPNNHAHDGGRASSEMEKECINQLGEMVGWESPLGHLCSGGTIANFEALWVARELNPQTTVLASSMSHYTHERLSTVLQVPFQSIPVDQQGRMRVDDLRRILKELAVPATVVVTLGTTGLGAVDPLQEILELQQQYPFRLHLDAAYGGYFRLVKYLEKDTKAAFELIHLADSFVIDPHKHGLQPYGCGCVMFRDRSVAAVYKHESPYTYFTSDDLHLGEISLECSRAGAAAVAIWATMQRFPLSTDGEFSERLSKSCRAATRLHAWLQNSKHFVPITQPELDVVVWVCRAETASQSSQTARAVFTQAADEFDLHLALITVEKALIEPLNAITIFDQEEIVCLRCCLMKPEHLDWMGKIIDRLERLHDDL